MAAQRGSNAAHSARPDAEVASSCLCCADAMPASLQRCCRRPSNNEALNSKGPDLSDWAALRHEQQACSERGHALATNHLQGLRQLSPANVPWIHGDEARGPLLQGHLNTISRNEGVVLNGLQMCQRGSACLQKCCQEQHMASQQAHAELLTLLAAQTGAAWAQAGRHTLCLTPFLSMNSRPRPGSWVLRFWASVTHLYWTEHTLSTSGTSLLNSSKQPHDPADSRPVSSHWPHGRSRCVPELLWASSSRTYQRQPAP